MSTVCAIATPAAVGGISVIRHSIRNSRGGSVVIFFACYIVFLRRISARYLRKVDTLSQIGGVSRASG